MIGEYTLHMALNDVSARLTKASRFAFIILVCVFLYGTPLPTPENILGEIKRHIPIQESLPRPTPWQETYAGYTYTFHPHASYEISGLVVSLHHSDSFIDISHAHDPAQTMDLCVVWGKNISSGAYQEVSYSHGDFTCFYRWEGPTIPDFRPDQIGNTHLIPTTPEIARIIKSVQVGDQVTMRGTLADYRITHPTYGEVGSRHTSLVRTDTGNGACEILLVESLAILKHNVPWRTPLMLVCLTVILTSLVLRIIAFYRAKRPVMGTLTGKPHAENPYNISSFLAKRGLLPKRHHSHSTPSRMEHIDRPTNASPPPSPD